MNWLAHLQLSGDSAETRIGNILPDLIGFQELQGISRDFMLGIELHRSIDAFTDRHPAFRRSVGRIDGPLRRYAGILVDLFYDHFLAQDWSEYSGLALEVMVGDFHASIDKFKQHLPESAYVRLAEIRDHGYLLTYASTDGVAEALRRVSARLRRPIDLAAGVDHLIKNYDSFRSDFREFYPLLRIHVESR